MKSKFAMVLAAALMSATSLTPPGAAMAQSGRRDGGERGSTEDRSARETLRQNIEERARRDAEVDTRSEAEARARGQAQVQVQVQAQAQAQAQARARAQAQAQADAQAQGRGGRGGPDRGGPPGRSGEQPGQPPQGGRGPDRGGSSGRSGGSQFQPPQSRGPDRGGPPPGRDGRDGRDWNNQGGRDGRDGPGRGGRDWNGQNGRDGRDWNGQNGRGSDYRPSPNRGDRDRGRPRYDSRRYPPQVRARQHYQWRGPIYRTPPGFYVTLWSYGDYLPWTWYTPNYYIDNWWWYGLDYPPAGFEWVRISRDAVLIDAWSGRIYQVVYDLFW